MSLLSDSNNGEFVYEEPPCSHTDGEGCVHVYYLVSNENRYAILALNEECKFSTPAVYHAVRYTQLATTC